MIFELHNKDVNPLILEHKNTSYILQPLEKISLENETDELSIKLYHTKNKKFNSIWYVLNEIFTLSQMRTVLVVDGKYTFRASDTMPYIDINNYEYVFHKDMSYETYVFNTSCATDIVHLQVYDQDKIYKKAKFLYLLGGNKTLFPLTGLALFSLSVQMLIIKDIPMWTWSLFFGVLAYFLYRLVSYIKSLKDLKNALEENNILKYMLSDKKEYRTFYDNLN